MTAELTWLSGSVQLTVATRLLTTAASASTVLVYRSFVKDGKLSSLSRILMTTVAVDVVEDVPLSLTSTSKL